MPACSLNQGTKLFVINDLMRASKQHACFLSFSVAPSMRTAPDDMDPDEDSLPKSVVIQAPFWGGLRGSTWTSGMEGSGAPLQADSH